MTEYYDQNQIDGGESTLKDQSVIDKLKDADALTELSSSDYEEGSSNEEISIVRSADHSSEDGQSEFSSFEHAYISDYIKFADQKAAIILTVSTALIGYIVSGKKTFWPLECSDCFAWSVHDYLLPLESFFLSSCLILLVLSAWKTFRALLPNLAGDADGIIFFKAIAEKFKDGEDYSHAINDLSGEEITGEKLKHCFELSKVCNEKYQCIRSSMILLFMALGVLAVTTVLSKLTSASTFASY